MFTINLEKELVSSKKASLSKDERNTLAEAEKILSNSTEEDIKILTSMGFNYSIEKSKELESKIKFIKAFDKTRVFSKDEIKELCVTYGLRFLPIDQFKGEIDPSLPSKVKEFKAIFESIIPQNRNSFYYRDFKICAPKTSFRLSERPVDPLIFYPIGGDDYFLVHKWGNDISLLNALKAWRHKHFGTWFLYVFMLYMLPLTVVSNIYFDWKLNMFQLLGITATITLGVSALLGMFEYFRGMFTVDNWNNPFRD